MGSETSTAALGEEKAREVINHWADGGFFRLKNMGDKIFVDQISPGAADTVQVHRPGPFEERTQRVAVPHTERVQTCGSCSGQGQVSCPSCWGQGVMTCPNCGGMGFVEQQIVDQGAQAEGGASLRTVRRGCTCSGGKVVCSGCGGNRMVRCSTCAGSGQVKTFEQLIVRFLTATQGEVLDVTPVPDNWLGRLSGEVLFDRKAGRIEECDSVPEAVAKKAQQLLAHSHAVDEAQERILLQLLHVERIPMQEVRYKYAGVERLLWICGSRQDVYAPKAPWNRKRLFGMIAGIAAAVAAVVALIVYLLLR
jgi:hypothetical protein